MEMIFILIMFVFALFMIYDVANGVVHKKEVEADPLYQFAKKLDEWINKPQN